MSVAFFGRIVRAHQAERCREHQSLWHQFVGMILILIHLMTADHAAAFIGCEHILSSGATGKTMARSEAMARGMG
jgi:hypothetical protein